MNVGTLTLMIAGLLAFAGGAWLAGTGDRTSGIALMGLGLLFQVLTLRQLKRAKKKDIIDAGR